ncbi:hypothetical protein CHARACLAT_009329 [Characodon lateralis]|uniref:Uncharacterized protein n=1 Tax=Characodon lateralis TaxID=208331 RepID=A0ABU7DIU7_9TELE|nr:hypothetical protein [Characodon lateralis]
MPFTSPVDCLLLWTVDPRITFFPLSLQIIMSSANIIHEGSYPNSSEHLSVTSTNHRDSEQICYLISLNLSYSRS